METYFQKLFLLFMIFSVTPIELSKALHPVQLSDNSYTKFTYEQIKPSSWPADNIIRFIRVAFQPLRFDLDGLFVYLEDLTASNEWFVLGARGGILVLDIKMSDGDPITMNLSEESLIRGQVYELIVAMTKRKMTTTLKCSQTTFTKSVPQPNDFQLRETTTLYIGKPFNVKNVFWYNASLPVCIYSIEFNDHVVLLPDSAVEAHNLKRCVNNLPTSCGSDYCGSDGICYKTLDCNDRLKVKEIRVNEHITKDSQPVEIGASVQQWIQIKFDNEVFVHGLRSSCVENSYENLNRYESGNRSFTLQVMNENTWYDYNEDENIQVFDLFRKPNSVYLSWPVAARTVRIRALNSERRSCSFSVYFLGCERVMLQNEIMDFFPPAAWLAVVQARSSDLDQAVRTYGVINEVWNDEERAFNEHLSDRFSKKLFKTKYVDILQALPLESLEVKVNLYDGSGKLTFVRETSISSCRLDSFDKFALLHDVQCLTCSRATSLPNTTYCRWTHLQGNSAAHDNETFVKVFIRRSFSALDAFRNVPNTGIVHQDLRRKSIAVSTTDQCAELCMKRSACNGFEVGAKPGSPALHCLLATKVEVGKLKSRTRRNTYLLREYFSRQLSLTSSGSTLPKGLLDQSYQCQCVNYMIGAKCDNNSDHHYTYHVVLSDRQKATELECVSSDRAHTIRVQFSIAGRSPNISLHSFTAATRNNDVKSISVLRYIQAFCDEKKSCTLSVANINSLMPPSAPEFSYVEIRYVCEATDEVQSASTTEAQAYSKAPTTVNSDASRRAESDRCSNCNNSENTTEIRRSPEINLSRQRFMLNLLNEPEAATSRSAERVGVTSPAANSTDTTTNRIPTEIPSFTEAQSQRTSASASGYKAMTTTDPRITTGEQLMTTLIDLAEEATTDVFAQTTANMRGTHYSDESPSQLKKPMRHESTRLNCTKSALGKVTECCITIAPKKGQLSHQASCISDENALISNAIDRARLGNFTDKDLSQIAQRQLNFISSSASLLHPGDITESVFNSERIFQLHASSIPSLTNLETTTEITESIQRTVDTLLDDALHEMWEGLAENERSFAANDLTKLVDNCGLLTAEQINGTSSQVKYFKNIALQAISLKSDAASAEGESHRIEFPNSSSLQCNESWACEAGSIVVPYRPAREKQNAVFVLYNSLEHLLGNRIEAGNDSKALKPDNAANSNDSKQFINSYVISATFKPLPKRLIKTEKVTFVLRHKRHHPQHSSRCVYWKHISNEVSSANPSGGYWSSDGCRTMQSNETHTRCECDHLTNFAILMSVTGVEISKEDDLVLSIITWVGCSLSVISLAASYFCFAVARGFQSTKNSIHKNLCATLALAQTIFLAGVEQTANKVVCSMIAAVLHYLFLTVFAWMCVEGIHLYVSLVKVFQADKASRLVHYYLFAYGAPMIVVAVSVALRHDGYGNDNSCWLTAKNDYLIWAFAGPALCVICANVFFFCVVLRVMRIHRASIPARMTRIAKTKTWLKRSSVLLCLLGITWIFGLLFIDSKSITMAYIFTTCNATQGVFVFVFHCLMNERVCSDVAKYIRRSRWCPSCIQSRYNVNSSSSVIARTTHFATSSVEFRRRSDSSDRWKAFCVTQQLNTPISSPTEPHVRNIIESDFSHRRSTGIDHQQAEITEQREKENSFQEVYLQKLPYFGLTERNEAAFNSEEIISDVSNTARCFEQASSAADAASSTSSTLDKVSTLCDSSNFTP